MKGLKIPKERDMEINQVRRFLQRAVNPPSITAHSPPILDKRNWKAY